MSSRWVHVIHSLLFVIGKYKKSSVKSENLALLLSLIPLERDKKKGSSHVAHCTQTNELGRGQDINFL